ncbi:alpha/beta hydrolase, partial [Bosea sp. CER48]|uniref:alpha/beta hydrolase n=1 Tax=Bosea sp. CER48 TaxID=3377035 RepID=UPI003801A767
MSSVPQALGPAAAGAPVPARIPNACQLDFTARDGALYRLLISVPSEPPPPAGFSAMVLVDGHALFATATAAATLQAQRPQVTGVGPAVFIGIGYPGESPFDAERRQRDLLPTSGGAARFLDVIVDEILPAVGRLAVLDTARLSLAGHSYGGLFVLHTLFTRPGLFAAHVAGSPSIWWNERAILASEEGFRYSAGPSG